jgi:hypothetical protein
MLGTVAPVFDVIAAGIGNVSDIGWFASEGAEPNTPAEVRNGIVRPIVGLLQEEREGRVQANGLVLERAAEEANDLSHAEFFANTVYPA